MDNRWYVISGGPCSGKSTVIGELAKRGYIVNPEAARMYIDRELAKGRSLEEVRSDPKEFQDATIHLKVEIELNSKPAEITFFDRGIPDTRGYLAYNNVPEDTFTRHAIEHCAYKKVFLLAPLPLENDYARNESPEEQLAIHQALEKAYESVGATIVSVPVMSLDERVDFVVENL